VLILAAGRSDAGPATNSCGAGLLVAILPWQSTGMSALAESGRQPPQESPATKSLDYKPQPELSLLLRVRHHHRNHILHPIVDFIGDRIDPATAAPRALRAQAQRVVVNDHDIVDRVTVALAIVRFIGGDCENDHVTGRRRNLNVHITVIGRPQ
jgi:hypothetical protein